MSLSDAAERVGVTPATLRRWIRQGLIPQYDGEWTRAAIGQARVVARMRARGHSLEQIRTATEEGRLAAPSAGGEVLVTRPVVEVARKGGPHLEFERIGEVTLKGFSESTEVFMASQRREESG